MKRFFTFLRKDAPKADANITMSIKGAFNTGGFGNDKTEGKGKYTFFFFAVPFFSLAQTARIVPVILASDSRHRAKHAVRKRSQ